MNEVRPETKSPQLHLAIFLLSLLTLLFQFAQTRLFSAALDHHLTFLVLSGALLGVGGGGTLAALVDQRTARPSSAQLALLAALSTLAALFVETWIDPIVEGMIVAIAAAYVMSVIPVLFVSWVIVRALRESGTSGVGRLYAADLAGAAIGGVLGYLAIGTLGAQGLYGVAAGAGLLACALLLRVRAPGRRRAAWAALAIAAVVAVSALGIAGEALARPLPGPLKAPEPGASSVAAKWDPLARIDVSRLGADGDPLHYAFLVPSAYSGARPPSLAMQLDLGALTPIVRGGAEADLRVLHESILAAPYVIAPRPRVLIVGPGGGIDLNVALQWGSTSVNAVEVNRTEVALMRGRFAEYSGRVYLDERVHIFEDEARSFIRRSSERFDVIPITVVDSYAALTAGAYALTENYLYTEEAMLDYLRHLTPTGVIAMSRWYRDPPLEIVRTLSVARSALRRLGHDDPMRSIVVLRYGNFGHMIIRETPWTDAELAPLRRFASANGYTMAFDPTAPSGALAAPTLDAPPTDDRPFFFDTVPLADVLAGKAELPYGYAVLLTTFVLSIALSAGGLLMPLYRRSRRLSSSLIPRGTAAALAIGFGFIAAEVVLLQRLTLYLGQPSLALSVGLMALLAGAAAGSAASERLRPGAARSAFACAIALAVIFTSLPLVTDATLAAPIVVRILISALATVLVGLPLGMVFPRLIAAVAQVDPALVSWVWAVNGTASVVGAVLGTAIALTGGFTALGIAGIACYLLAALAAQPWRARAAGRATAM